MLVLSTDKKTTPTRGDHLDIFQVSACRIELNSAGKSLNCVVTCVRAVIPKVLVAALLASTRWPGDSMFLYVTGF